MLFRSYTLSLHPTAYHFNYTLLKFKELYFPIPAPDPGKKEVKEQMGNQKCPGHRAKHIDPSKPAKGTQIGEELGSTVALYRSVESPHDAVQVAFKPKGMEGRQTENGKLLSLHAPVDRFPSQPYIPGNPDL